MSKKLYSNSDKKIQELKNSKERVSQLSIEYDPRNQVKKDLQIQTYQDEIDMRNTGKLIEITNLEDKFAGRRVVDNVGIFEFCVKNNYTLLPISHYRSELSDKSLDAILKFKEDNKIDLNQNRDNFFILAPRKYFKYKNLDLANAAFNIYYQDGFERFPKITGNLVEIYGSNFENSFAYPLNEMSTVSNSGKNSSGGFFIISLVLYFACFLLSMLIGGVGRDGLITMNAIIGFPAIIGLLRYKLEYSDGAYIGKMKGESADFLKEGKFYIKN